MSAGELDIRLDPRRIEPSRGLEKNGEDWTLFGLTIDPDALARLDDAARAAFDRLWLGPPKWSRDDPGIFHGLVAGARAEIRALVARGVPVRGVTWADLGGSTGHYAVALALEGARRVRMVDEREPGATARGVLDVLGIEVVVGDAYGTPLDGIEAILALYSIDPRALPGSRADVLVVAPPMAASDGLAPRAARRASGFAPRQLSWTSPLMMGEGHCRLGAPEIVTMEIWKRRTTVLLSGLREPSCRVGSPVRPIRK